MHKSIILFLTLLFPMTEPLWGTPEGEAVYKQFCSACHGHDGKGIEGATFPPLAGSEWLQEGNSRIAQILLHGLTGPIKVKGKHYNLMMPPQGSLSDEDKVKVINYLRVKWGTQKHPYTLQQLTIDKRLSAARNKPWTADKLLRLHPLVKEPGPLKDLLMTTYKGTWSSLPDFDKLESDSTEEEHEGYLSLRRINLKQNFGIVWTGKLTIKQQGRYQFEIDSDDTSRLVINGEPIVRINGLGPMGRNKTATIPLKQGEHQLRFEYTQAKGGIGIKLRYRPVGDKEWHWLSDKTTTKGSPPLPVIDLTPDDNKVRIYNNFIAGSGPRAIAVGFPKGPHYTFNTDLCTLDTLWKGRFISAGRHWTNRGQGFEPPLGVSILGLSQGKPAWQIDKQIAATQFKGYTLDSPGNPTLRYTISGIACHETFKPTDKGTNRFLTFTNNSSQTLSCVLKETFKGSIKNNTAKLANGATISIPEDSIHKLKVQDGKLVVIIANSRSTKLSINYQWSH